MGLEDLPTELVHRIFVLLPFHDLKSAALVCCRLARIATSPRLWEHFNCDGFAMSKQGLKHYLTVLQIPRFETDFWCLLLSTSNVVFIGLRGSVVWR